MLTTLQLAALNTFIEADPTLSAETYNQAGAEAIAAALNADTDPEVYVWNNSVAIADLIAANPLKDTTNVDSANSREWDSIAKLGTLDMGNATVRGKVQNIWPGLGLEDSVRETILAACKRVATVAELALLDDEAGGDGTEDDPYILVYAGPVSWQEVYASGDWSS